MDRTKVSKAFLTTYKYYILTAIIVFATFLRLYNLNSVPVSLFGDELDLGYQAFSILKTGKDYSGDSWPIHFHSLAEWRTPLYLYSAVPTVALFGISPLGVRLPATFFGIATIPIFYLLVKKLTNSEKLGLIGSLVLTISPWHIQYSRAGFEVTQMVFFLVLGVLLFLRSLTNKGSLLWLAGICFALMPWGYSTAKLFTPAFIVFLTLIYWKDLVKLPQKSLLIGVVSTIVVAFPIAWSTLFGGGTQRFSDISIFSDPTIETTVGTSRLESAYNRGQTVITNPSFLDRLFYNKYTYLGNIAFSNVLMPFSTDFLFINGDPNPRHSIDGMGELYRIEFVFLLFGLSFFALPFNRKTKLMLIGWLLLGVIPSTLTFSGGIHATRLILILLPLLFIVTFGIERVGQLFNKKISILLSVFIIGAYALSFISYQNVYWIHNPYQSEKWWHYGWEGAIKSMMSVSNQYKHVIITTADEPPWIFFAAWSSYDPSKWQMGYPFKKVDLPGFGSVSFIDKYYFGSPSGKKGLYDWGSILTSDDLYIASAKEVNVNLILEPRRLPLDLKLIKSVAYPSGEPAFYLFSGVSNLENVATTSKKQ